MLLHLEISSLQLNSSTLQSFRLQRSGVGPSSYVIVASDLRPRHSENRMMKYADDTYVLVGSAMVHTVTDEFNNIQSWAAKNNLKIHPSKTKEIIFSRRCS